MNNDNFFGTENYEIPETSDYMKFKTEGAHKFRALSSAIVGYEYFKDDNKPVRSRTPFDATPGIKKNGKISHFWAFIVWNYSAKRIQILEIQQKTIQTAMKAYINNPDWGNPKNYDITVSRKGMTVNDTEYTVMPSPHKPLDADIAKKFGEAKINLEALFDDMDPFSVDK